jgi:serine/threonine protein kinase
VRPTPRNPSLYVGTKNFKRNDKNEPSVSLFHLKPKEGSPCLQFGITHSDVDFGHMFSRSGQCQVIQVPFEEGAHVCTSAGQGLSLIQDLKDLHAQGFVHGDIRASNCAFSDEDSRLIDFDFGGLVNVATYPERYIANLIDGRRVSASESCAPIQKWHDVYALASMLLINHEYEEGEAAQFLRLYSKTNALAVLVKGESHEYKNIQAAGLLASLEEFMGTVKTIQPAPALANLLVPTQNLASKKTVAGHGGTP